MHATLYDGRRHSMTTSTAAEAAAVMFTAAHSTTVRSIPDEPTDMEQAVTVVTTSTSMVAMTYDVNIYSWF